MNSTEFENYLIQFTQRALSGDVDTFLELFARDAVYVDGFYGAYEGHDGIRELLKHVADAGTNYTWTMHEGALDGDRGYARYVLQYDAAMPGADGARVVIEGMCQFAFRDGLITRYYELFDRGVGLAQIGFPPERIAKSLNRWAEWTRDTAKRLESS